MAYSKIALSLPTDILTWLDQMAAAQQQSRSGFIREVLEARRAQEEHEQIVAEWKTIYDEIAEDEIAMSEAFLAISTVPHLEWNPEEEDELPATG